MIMMTMMNIRDIGFSNRHVPGNVLGTRSRPSPDLTPAIYGTGLANAAAVVHARVADSFTGDDELTVR